jgi:hypothetical protein
VNRQDAVAYIKRGLKKDASWAEKAVALNWATGARPIEVISEHTSNFIPGDKDGEIIQIGRAKAKGEKQWEEYKQYRYKSRQLFHLTYKQFVTLLADVRRGVKHEETEGYAARVEENKRLSRTYVSKMSRIGAADVPQTAKYGAGNSGIYIARKSYAGLTHDKSGPQNLIGYSKEVLGHQSLGTSLSYQSVAIRQPIEIESAVSDELRTEVKYLRQEIGSMKTQMNNKYHMLEKRIQDTFNASSKPSTSSSSSSAAATLKRTRRMMTPSQRVVEIEVLPNKRYLSDEEHKQRVRIARNRLTEHGIPETIAALKRVGLSYEIINKFR